LAETETRAAPDDEATEACRHVAELLGYRSVDTVSDDPAAVEDVLEGRVDGLIVFRPDEAPPSTALPAQTSPAPGGPAIRALDAVRAAAVGGGSTRDILAAVRDAVRASTVALLVEREGAVAIHSPAADVRPARLPHDLWSELLALPRSVPLDGATIGRLRSALGLRSPRTAAMFCTEDGPAEVLLVGWDGPRSLSDRELASLARGVSIAHAAVERRDAAVATGLREARLRWANGIHDGLTQAITGALLELKTLRARIDRDPAAAIASLDDAMAEVQRSVVAVRSILFDLVDDDEIEGDGDRLSYFAAGVAARWQLPLSITVEGDLELTPRSVRSALTMILREGIANIAKHADAAKVVVRVTAGRDEVLLEIEDDGRGFDPSKVVDRPGHYGLRLVEERVAACGGALHIESHPGGGTTVVARVPLRAGAQGEMQ
jgi:signal transduction histidine kinase